MLKNVEQHQLQITKRGSRKARKATLDVKYASVAVKAPLTKKLLHSSELC